MAREILFSFLIIAAAAACVGDNPDTTGTTPGVDAGDPNGDPVGQTLIINGGFEDGVSGFSSTNAEITSETTTIRHGKALKVCKILTDEAGYYVYGFIGVQPNDRDVFKVSAWMREAPGTKTGGNPPRIAIVGMDADGSPLDAPNEGSIASGPFVDDRGWKEVTTTWTVSNDRALNVRLDIGFQTGEVGNCFLIDDLSFTKQ